MGDVRLPRVRGAYHRQLVALLLEKIAEGAATQESLADATRMHQTTISGILKRDAGTFDLDEANAALNHVGGSLRSFVLDPAQRPAGRPPIPPEVAKLARLLKGVEAEGLKAVLATARAVRTASRRKDMQQGRRSGAGHERRASKTAGTR